MNKTGKILVPTDFSAHSRSGIRFALEVALKMKARPVFYTVIEKIHPDSSFDTIYESYSKSYILETTQKLKSFIKSVWKKEERLLANSDYIVEIGLPTDEMIIEYAKKCKAAYICLSTRGAGTFKKLIGTTAASLVANSPIPVITVPAGLKVKPVKTLFFACDMIFPKAELKIIKPLARRLNAIPKVYHYEYLPNISESKKRLSEHITKYKSGGLNFIIEPKSGMSLSEQILHDVKKEKDVLVVLFTKQFGKNWFERLFFRSEAAEMSFNAVVPVLTFKKSV